MKSPLAPAGYALVVILCLPLSVEAHRAWNAALGDRPVRRQPVGDGGRGGLERPLLLRAQSDSARADALATALTVLGAEAGLAYASRRSLAALFIERGPRGIEERMNAGLRGHARMTAAALLFGGAALGVPGDRLAAAAAVAVVYGAFCALAAYRHRRRRQRRKAAAVSTRSSTPQNDRHLSQSPIEAGRFSPGAKPAMRKDPQQAPAAVPWAPGVHVHSM